MKAIEGRAPRTRRDEAWIALGLALLAAALAWGQWTWRLDRLFYDQALVLWAQAPPPDITIVAIDDASVAAIGRWPWRRAVHATVLERLAAARPRAVALDLILSEPDPSAAQDALLAAAMQRAAPLVLPVPWVSVGGAPPRWLEPVPLLAAAATPAAAETVADADGILRHTFLHVGESASMRPHVALALLHAGGEQLHPALHPQAHPTPSAARGWQRDGRLLIRYSGAPGHVQRVSYVDVLRGAVPAEQLAGRYLLVGMTAQGLGDTVATPVNAQRGPMPGVEVIAQTLHMLRSGHGLRAVPQAGVAAASALAAFAGVLFMARLGQRAALAWALVTALAVPLASMAAVGWGWWFAPTPLVATALLAYPLWSWRRLEATVVGLDTEIRDLSLAPPEGTAPPVQRDAIEARLLRLRSAGELLREARRFLADVLASLPTAMLVADEFNRVVMGNAQAAALFEAGGAEELHRLDLVRLLSEFTPAEAQDWPAVVAALVPGGAAPAVHARLAEQGDFVVQLAGAELAGARRVLVTITDLAAIRRAERQREEALAFVSHDLRSPATTLLLLADAALAKGARRAEDELMPLVRRLAGRMLEMSEAFVRYAQADLVTPLRAPVALSALFDDAIDELRPQAAAAGIRFATTLVPPQAQVCVDAALVVRAITNLLSNALRHGPPNATVLLQGCHDGSELVVCVTDEGPGLSAEQQQDLLQGDDGLRSVQARGIGLGLRFVQRVARRHGGSLRWRAAQGYELACFELRLPASAKP